LPFSGTTTGLRFCAGVRAVNRNIFLVLGF